MAKKNARTAKEVIKAIEKSRGYVTKAADILGVSRQSLYRYLKKFPTAQIALDDTREKRHEWVENKLIQQIDANVLTAIIFYLKTQGKHLGYVERQEIATPKDQPLQIEYVNDWRDKAALSASGAANSKD